VRPRFAKACQKQRVVNAAAAAAGVITPRATNRATFTMARRQSSALEMSPFLARARRGRWRSALPANDSEQDFEIPAGDTIRAFVAEFPPLWRSQQANRHHFSRIFKAQTSTTPIRVVKLSAGSKTITPSRATRYIFQKRPVWRSAVMQSGMGNADVELVVVEVECLGVLEAPLERGVVVAVHSGVEVRDYDIFKRAFQQDVLVPVAPADDKYLHVASQHFFVDQLPDRSDVEIRHLLVSAELTR